MRFPRPCFYSQWHCDFSSVANITGASETLEPLVVADVSAAQPRPALAHPAASSVSAVVGDYGDDRVERPLLDKVTGNLVVDWSSLPASVDPVRSGGPC